MTNLPYYFDCLPQKAPCLSKADIRLKKLLSVARQQLFYWLSDSFLGGRIGDSGLGCLAGLVVTVRQQAGACGNQLTDQHVLLQAHHWCRRIRL